MTAPPFVERVIKNCLRINKDDRVCIFTWRHTIDLAEAFAIECEKLGAQVGIDLTTDDLWYDHVFNSQIDALETPNSFELALDGVATATIFIAGPENPARLKKGSAERWIAYSRAGRQSYQRLLERKVRIAGISLGQVTPQRAKTMVLITKNGEKMLRMPLTLNTKKCGNLEKKCQTFCKNLTKSK